MRIDSLTTEPVHYVPYVNAARKGGTEVDSLAVLTGQLRGLPAALDALVLTADLQGVVFDPYRGGDSVLLGVALADELCAFLERDGLASPARTGVVLAGDLYATPAGDVRGASGDVRDVWLALASRFRWVVGVPGNHDQFGTDRQRRRFEDTSGVHLLDGSVVRLDDIAIGGVGGIVGNPRKPMRREQSDFLTTVERVLSDEPALLVMHEGPAGDRGQRGNAFVREALDEASVPLTVCGHAHWRSPLAELARGQQVLNVDARVVVLRS